MAIISELLDLRKTGNAAATRPEVVAVIGSGGKTSLLWLLAESLRSRKVLVTTTVKMRPPEPGQADCIAANLEGADLSPRPGVTFAAIPWENGKVTSLPLPLLEKLFPLFDISLLECDGASERPYKGWAGHEPVMPEAVTLTIAVIPVPSPEWTVTERWVHRLPLFCGITGAHPDDELRPEHIAGAIAHPEGLLAKARGRIVLFFNQVQNQAGEEFARKAASLLPSGCRERLTGIIVGSVRANQGFLLDGSLNSGPQ